jgi:hypothetical protein
LYLQSSHLSIRFLSLGDISFLSTSCCSGKNFSNKLVQIFNLFQKSTSSVLLIYFSIFFLGKTQKGKSTIFKNIFLSLQYFSIFSISLIESLYFGATLLIKCSFQ